MDKILTNITAPAFDKYFRTLSKLGYLSDDKVNSLIVLSFIEDLLTSELNYFITEDDYRTITKALSCMFGSNCLIGIPDWQEYNNIYYKTKRKATYRISEESLLRNTEDNLFRILA